MLGREGDRKGGLHTVWSQVVIVKRLAGYPTSPHFWHRAWLTIDAGFIETKPPSRAMIVNPAMLPTINTWILIRNGSGWK